MNGRFVKDMPNETYHALDGVSKSGLDKMARSPAHYLAREFKSSTRAMTIGTAIHAAILEPERFEDEYFFTGSVDRTKMLYKHSKKIRGEELSLTAPEGRKVLNMRRAIESNETAMAELNKEGDAELSAICIDPETGIQLRARFDFLNCDRVVVDVKKTQDLRKFGRSVEDYRYNVQEMVYRHVYRTIAGEELDKFYFLAVEEEAPHSNAMFLLDDYHREIGDFYFRRDLRAYAECINSGKWPHLSHELIIEPSNFAFNAFERDCSHNDLEGFTA